MVGEKEDTERSAQRAPGTCLPEDTLTANRKKEGTALIYFYFEGIWWAKFKQAWENVLRSLEPKGVMNTVLSVVKISWVANEE